MGQGRKRELPIGLSGARWHVCLDVHDAKVVRRAMASKGVKVSKLFSMLINQGLAAKLPVFEVEE